MPIYLNSNSTSIHNQFALSNVTRSINKSLERLSTGFKINKAGDGAGSLLASEQLRSRIRGVDVALTNVQQGLSILQTADGAMQEIYSHLQSMRDIALAARNSTTTTEQFAAYQADYQAHQNAVNFIASNTRYNDFELLDGSIATMMIQAGPTASDNIDIVAGFTTNTASQLGVSGNTLATVANASSLLTEVDTAMQNLSTKLATNGGYQSRMESQLNTLSIAKENYTSAEASIRNTDVAAETARLTQLQIIQQAAAYALAQANTQPNIALSLLQ